MVSWSMMDTEAFSVYINMNGNFFLHCSKRCLFFMVLLCLWNLPCVFSISRISHKFMGRRHFHNGISSEYGLRTTETLMLRRLWWVEVKTLLELQENLFLKKMHQLVQNQCPFGCWEKKIPHTHWVDNENQRKTQWMMWEWINAWEMCGKHEWNDCSANKSSHILMWCKMNRL